MNLEGSFLGGAVGDQRELLAASAGNEHVAVDAGLEDAGNDPQDLVPGGVEVTVVGVLEEVYHSEDQGTERTPLLSL